MEEIIQFDTFNSDSYRASDYPTANDLYNKEIKINSKHRDELYNLIGEIMSKYYKSNEQPSSGCMVIFLLLSTSFFTILFLIF